MKDEVKARFQLAAARVRAAAELVAPKPVTPAAVAPPEVETHTGYTSSRIIRARKR